MPLRERSALALAALSLACVAGGTSAGVGGCSSSPSDQRPSPALASSPAAGGAFEAIREAWRTPEHVNAAALRDAIERFLVRYPSDGLVPLARLYLALVAMKQEDFATADREIALTAALPSGTPRDLWTIARARRLRLRGEPEAGIELLRPLIGKSVDPVVRTVFQEELTLVALATHRDYEAISYMDAWLRASTEDEKEQTAKAVAATVERLPRDVLVGALQAMRVQRASFGYGVDIERILAERLVHIATTSGDAELARMLLDPDAGAIVVAGDAGVELGELATSRRGLNVVDGRTVGLLLPTESPGLRDESADVLRGVMWALGLPRGVRVSSTAAPAARDGGAPVTCAPRESAPPLEEPRTEEGVRLMTRDDAGSADRTEVSLDELAGAGAAIIIAGLDEQTAERALRWGENHRVPVVALVPPDASEPQGSFGFVLGEPRARAIAALARAAALPATASWAPVVDMSELARLPAQGGLFDELTLLPPVSCDIPAVRAGDPRFPIAQWATQKTHAWLVSGSPGCSRDVVSELGAAGARGVVALTLEAAAWLPHTPGLRLLVASAGLVPDTAAAEARDDELRRFASTLGHASWWTALGRDAATLARLAVRQLPLEMATASAVVEQRRAQARDVLAAARAPLWSTEATGWGAAHTVPRTVCALASTETSSK